MCDCNKFTEAYNALIMRAPSNLDYVWYPRKFVPLGENWVPHTNMPDRVGQTKGKLTILGVAGKSNGRLCFGCSCECGRFVVVLGQNFGRQATCGRCIRDYHGLSHTKIHRTWLAIINRCHNPKTPGFTKYGAKGVAVCDKWKNSFAAFLADVGHPPSAEYSLDRIESRGNYEPGNCRWATTIEQGNNRTNSRLFIHEGKPMSVPEIARKIGISASTITTRLRRGWTLPQAIGTSLRKHSHMKCRLPNKKTHGMTGTKVYRAWNAIKNRCYNKNTAEYKDYGARGISVFEGWVSDFSAFYNHVGDPPSAKHSLDRIDGTKGYEPGNVRWATKSEQAINRRALQKRGSKKSFRNCETAAAIASPQKER